MPRLLPGGDLLGRGILAWLGWRGVDLAGERRGQPPVALVDAGLDAGMLAEQVTDPSVLTAVWSCMRPGRTAPVHNVRPAWSLQVVVLTVFCLRLPDTNARRPGRWARGRRTWVSVASMRTWTPQAWA